MLEFKRSKEKRVLTQVNPNPETSDKIAPISGARNIKRI